MYTTVSVNNFFSANQIMSTLSNSSYCTWNGRHGQLVKETRSVDVKYTTGKH